MGSGFARAFRFRGATRAKPDPIFAEPGRQLITIDASGGLTGYLAGSGATTGDIIDAPLVTAVHGYTLTIDSDGRAISDAGGDESHDYFLVRIYDVSEAAWSGYFSVHFNDFTPTLLATPVPIENWLIRNVAIAPINVLDAVTDAEDDITSSTITSGTLPTGLTFSEPNISGTPTVNGVNRYVVTHEDEAGNELEVDRAIGVRPQRPTLTGLVQDLSLVGGELMTPEDFSTEFGHESGSMVGVTYTLRQIGTPTVVTEASGRSDSGRALTVVDAAAIAVGGYVGAATDDMALVLAKYFETLELAVDIAWEDGDPIYYAEAPELELSGLTFASDGELTGTPPFVATPEFPEESENVVVRAADSNGEIKDSNAFTISIVDITSAVVEDRLARSAPSQDRARTSHRVF